MKYKYKYKYKYKVLPFFYAALATVAQAQASNFEGQWVLKTVDLQSSVQQTVETITTSSTNSGSVTTVCNINMTAANIYHTDCLGGADLNLVDNQLNSEDGSWSIIANTADQLSGSLVSNDAASATDSDVLTMNFSMSRRIAESDIVGSITIQRGLLQDTFPIHTFVLSQMVHTANTENGTVQSDIQQISIDTEALKLQLINIDPGTDLVEIFSPNLSLEDMSNAEVKINASSSIDATFSGTDASGSFSGSLVLNP
ncbi:MAG: hypothetical protein HRU20_23755 [Pseudomonadales bacterium]|nr:hypothetical protein [Pseudomonadales bacterium]